MTGLESRLPHRPDSGPFIGLSFFICSMELRRAFSREGCEDGGDRRERLKKKNSQVRWHTFVLLTWEVETGGLP